MATSDNLPLPNCDSDGKAENMRQRTVVWLIYHQSECQQGSFLHEHARPLNQRCAWRLTTGFAFIKMARLKAIIAISLLVGLGECACDLKQNV